MSRAWAGGSTATWKPVRRAALQRANYTCELRLPGCTTWATQARHILGRAVTGDDPGYVRASCWPCNRRVGDPATHGDPHPVPRTRWWLWWAAPPPTSIPPSAWLRRYRLQSAHICRYSLHQRISMSTLLGNVEPRLFTPPVRPISPDTSAGFALCEWADANLAIKLLPHQRWTIRTPCLPSRTAAMSTRRSC